MQDFNPYSAESGEPLSTSESDAIPIRRSQSLAAWWLWGLGTFSFSLLIGIDLAVESAIASDLFIITLLLGTIIAIAGALMIPGSNIKKSQMIAATILLIPTQLVLLSLFLIATTGMKGIH